MAAGVALLSSEKEFKLPALTKPKVQKHAHTLPATDGPSHKTEKNLSRPQTSSNQPGLIIVRYGANKKMILNSFCQTRHLLNVMKRLSGCTSLEHVDLMSWRAGEIQNISKLKCDYAYRFLKARETYLLVKVTETYDESQSLPQYMSLLDDLEIYSPELVAKLEQLSRPGKSLSLKNKWSTMSRKGMDGRAERKSGLNSILASHQVKAKHSKSDIIGVIAAVRKSAGSDNQNRHDTSMERYTKLPPLTKT